MQLAIYDLLGALFAPSASDLPSISSHSHNLFTQVCAIVGHRFADPDIGPSVVAAEAHFATLSPEAVHAARLCLR
jgi:AraC family transcriptional regulator, positive regulator of tynA and feaB